MKYFPDLVFLMIGRLVMAFLLLLGALDVGRVAPFGFLGLAAVYFGCHRTLANRGCRSVSKDPDDFDCHFPG
jgi:hypothetical protein